MYTVRLRLDLCNSEKRFFSKCFSFANTIHNTIVSTAQRRLNALFHDREYMTAHIEYGESGYAKKNAKQLFASQKKRKKQLSDIMKAKQEEYKLRQTDLEKSIKQMRWKYSKYISSQQAQAEAKAVYAGVSKVLFDNGKHLHYKRFNQFDCIKQKNTGNGVKVLDWKTIEFMDHKYHIAPIPKTHYMQEVLNSTVLFAGLKYAYLKRIEFESGYRYYVILTLSGSVPKKLQKCNHENRTGVDFGTSSIATASNDELNLVELAPRSGEYEKQIRYLQNLVDHKTRIHNKDNYDESGRVKKGHHT